ncbi:HNH endonuclease [Kitasatospora sp. NPDC086009]|uniref:HNH endonuclease n=1 Tax=unclassified Kitasatospora TaxID=2633591 RepID=UPI0037CB95C0
MSLGDLTRSGVQAAIREHELLGQAMFNSRYGFEPSSTYKVALGNKVYDATAVAAVGHLYSTGTLPAAATFHDEEPPEVSRLRGLGFIIQQRGSAEAPQLILQPRGDKDGGPAHFAKSVRRGVQVSDLRRTVGAESDVLTSLYPGGVARLWGSTPTTEPNNEKVRALRDRRVGDDVFFYTGYRFFARARVIGLFTSSAIARAVWGVGKDGTTWEHIMALDDFEEFPQPILAAEALKALQVPLPLRMLTLRSAADYASAGRLLHPIRATPLTATELLTRLTALRIHQNSANGAASRHQPLALLWAIARIAAGEPRLTPWSLFKSEVGTLLSDFGLPESKVTPEYPFWHLQGSGLWEIHGASEYPGPMPRISDFTTSQPVAGIPHETAELLRDPVVRLEALVRLRNRYLRDVDQRALFDRLGLSGYTTADALVDATGTVRAKRAAGVERATGATMRRESTSSRIVRDAAIALLVKEIHDYKCQVCRTRLQYKFKPYSEAAHIRGLGSPHDGPDELHNLLCLCPNHHVLFDGLEIYVDAEYVVRQTRGGEPLGNLHRHDDHPIDEEYLGYHRSLCELNA